ILRLAFCLCFSPLVLLISEHVLEKTAGLGHLSNRPSPAPEIGVCAGRKPSLPRPARPRNVQKLERRESGMIASKFVATDRKSTRLNSSHLVISYAVFCL